MITSKEKLAYGFGYFGYFIANAVTSMWLIKYYEDVLKLDAILIGYAYLIYAIWNALNDPLFGIISDKTSTKLGRRRPYLIFLSPIFSLSFILLWYPLISGDFLWIYLTIALIFFDTFYTIIGINYLSLLPEMTIDSVERSELSAISQVFAVIGLAIGWTIPIFFYKSVPLMVKLALILGLFVFLSPFVTGLFVKERYEVETHEIGFIESLKIALSSRSFIIFVAFNFMFTMASFTIIPSIPYFTEYNLGLSSLYGFILILLLFISAVIGFPLVLYLTKKYGTKKTMLISLSILELGLLLNLLVKTFEHAVISMFFMGIGVSAPLVLINVMIGDIVDEDAVNLFESRNIKIRREGAFFGVNALITKPAISIGAYVIALIHDVTGYKKGALIQPESALLGLRMLVSVIPFIMVLVAMAILLLYPLDGDRLDIIKKKARELGLG